MNNFHSLLHNVVFFKVYPGNKTVRLNDIELGFYYKRTTKYIVLCYSSTLIPYNIYTDNIILC